MKSYYRVMLGRGSNLASDCFKEGIIGAGYGIERDLTAFLAEDWREFSRKLIPIYLKQAPEKSKIAAGLACGCLWTMAKGIRQGDIVLSRNGAGAYRVGTVTGLYMYRTGEVLPHQRAVAWSDRTIEREDISPELRGSVGSQQTICNITKHAVELEKLIAGQPPPSLVSPDETVEDPAVFALEKHLEEFLAANWPQTPLGKRYDIYQEDEELVGVQYPTDTGPIDILAISKDKKELLVVELKKGRASDAVIGQIQRYMGYVLEELADKNQAVRGVIIALEDDIRIRRSLAVAKNIEFFRYQVSFALIKG